jgi:hypothetical protein
MKKTRSLHLWIGIITSVFILIESVTGLLLSEPWLMGVKPRGGMGNPAAIVNQTISASNPNSQNSSTSSSAIVQYEGRSLPSDRHVFDNHQMDGGSGLSNFIRGLHEGQINGLNVKWLVDVTAIGLIVLTVTGISMSIRALCAASHSRKRKHHENLLQMEDDHNA